MCFLFSFGPLHLPLTHTWGQFGFQPQVNTKSASPIQSWCSCQLGSLTSNDPQAMDKHIANYDLHNDVVPQSLLVLFHFPNLAACSFAVNLLHTFGERGFKFPSSDGRLWCRPSLHPHILLLCCHLLQVSAILSWWWLLGDNGIDWWKMVVKADFFSKTWQEAFFRVRATGRQTRQAARAGDSDLGIELPNIIDHLFPHHLFYILSVFSITIIPWLSGVGDYSVVGQTKQREKSLTITFSTIFVAFIICFVPWCEHFNGVRRTILN